MAIAARDAVLLLVLTTPLLFSGLANHGFWRPDEPFVAEVSREMAATGDWVIPRLNGRLFLEKPPLHYVATALSMRALGVTPLAARLPSFVAGVIAVFATWLLGKRLFDRVTAMYAAAALPTVLLMFYTTHYCLVDASLLPMVTLGFLGAGYAFGEDRRAWAIPVTYAAAALAFHTKGIVGPGLILLGLGTAAVVRRQWRVLVGPAHLAAVAIFGAIVSPWLIAVWREGGAPFLRENLVINTVGRFLAASGMVPAGDRPGLHAEPPWMYLATLPALFLPWTPMLLPAIRTAIGRRGSPGSPRLEPGETILWCFFLPGILVLTSATTKRNIYLLPLVPVLALLAARQARRAPARETMAPPWRRLLVTQALVASAASLAVPVIYLMHPPPGDAGGLRWSSLAMAAVLCLPACLGAVVIARGRARPGSPWFFPALWAQASLALILFATFCVPSFDDERSFGPFFREAVRIEKERGATPSLYCTHESFIGLAGLAFDRVLPELRLHDDPASDPAGDPVDVLTTVRGFRELSSLKGSRCTILFRWDAGVEYPFSTLFLLSFSERADADP